MDKIKELEMRIKILEKTVNKIINENPLISYPDKSDISSIKMESYNEMKKEYPNENIKLLN